MIPAGILGSARSGPGVFTDGFNRADGAIGANWANIENSLVVVSNRAGGSSAATNVASATTPTAGNDGYAQVEVATVGGTSMGIMARMPGTVAHTGYLWRYSGTACQLFKVVAGTATALGTAYTATLTAPFTLRIEVSGSTITGYVDGVQRQQVTDTGLTTGSYCGLRVVNTTARYDNFEMGNL